MLLACAERAGVVDQNWDRDAEGAGEKRLPQFQGPLDAVAVRHNGRLMMTDSSVVRKTFHSEMRLLRWGLCGVALSAAPWLLGKLLVEQINVTVEREFELDVRLALLRALSAPLTKLRSR